MPHNLQLPQHQFIRIHKPIHAILQARLLISVQLARLDRARDALSEADVRVGVDVCGVVINIIPNS
jgi:hypothetical protein